METKGRYLQLFDSNSNPVFLVAADGRIVDADTVAVGHYGYSMDELLESESRFRSYMEQAPEGIFIADGKGNYIDVNEAASDITGYSREELLRTSLVGLAAPEDKEIAFSHFQNVIDTGRSVGDIRLLTKEGKKIVCTIKTVKLGETGFLGYVSDVTNRAKAEEALRLQGMSYRKLFENNISGIIITEMVMDENGYPIDFVFLEANDAFETHSGLKVENVLGKRVTEVLPGIENSENTALALHRKVVLTGIPSSSETYSEYLKRHFSINSYLIKENTVVGVFQDISERKQVETEIRKLNTELEHRVAERTSELEKANKELEKANKELEAFAYSVSHDLRAPLRAIDGFSKIILEDYDELFDDEGKRLFDIIRTNTKRMDALITDLLTLSRVSRNEMNFIDIGMTSMVRSVFADIAFHKEDKNIIITVPDLPASCGDPSLIRQVWTNLLSNSVKYSMDREEIRIEVGAYTEDDRNVYYVKDNGVGFDPKYDHKLFGIFQRLHTEKEFEGTGVGLAIVQRIIGRHGGQVWAEGAVNEGATFYFSLPLKEDGHECGE